MNAIEEMLTNLLSEGYSVFIQVLRGEYHVMILEAGEEVSRGEQYDLAEALNDAYMSTPKQGE